MTAIVGGSKVSTKLEVLDALVDKVDSLIVGGGIANTFLAATGVEVGASLCEEDLFDTARKLLDRVDIPCLPTLWWQRRSAPTRKLSPRRWQRLPQMT